MKFKKPLILVLIAFLGFASARAQYLPERGEWFHFSYSHLTLLNQPEQLEQNWKSNGWQLMLLRETLFGRKSHWGVAYGLGFNSNFWHTNLNISSISNISSREYTYLPSDSSYKSNRFSASYIDIPVEFRFRTRSNSYGQYFRFYFGGLVGYRINSFAAFQTGNYSVKYYKQDDLARWHYGIFLRTGWWLFNLYAYYGINPVFDKFDNAPEGLDKMQSLSLGLSISL